MHSAKNTLDGATKKDKAAISFTMNVIVSIKNPRIIFLENPEFVDSRAIVARCGASVQYCTHTDEKVSNEIRETLHFSLQTLEIFAVTGLKNGRPMQIMEPTAAVRID